MPIGVLALQGAFAKHSSMLQALGVDFDDATSSIEGTFIRAPRILSLGDEVLVIGRFSDDAVLVQQGGHLASSFHPELGDDLTVHRHFVKLCRI